MYIHNHYVMRDQAKDVIPELMGPDACGRRSKAASFGEFLLFSVAVVLYLAALGLSN